MAQAVTYLMWSLNQYEVFFSLQKLHVIYSLMNFGLLRRPHHIPSLLQLPTKWYLLSCIPKRPN
jgi:hypothetical protein